MKDIHTQRTSESLNSGIYEISDINTTLKTILPDNVEVSVTIDCIRINSKLKIDEILIFTDKSFFIGILGFTRARSYPLDDFDGFYQLIAGSYKSDRPINITGFDEIHLKCDCINGSIVNGIREPILYCFAFEQPPARKVYKEHRVKLFKKLNKSVLSHKTFYLEDDDHKPVDLKGETISLLAHQLKFNKLMNLNLIRPKNETEKLLLSITKNCETLVNPTHKKPEETLEFKLIKPNETFHFNPTIQVKEDWMLGLVNLEVYNSVFNITEEHNKFEIYKFLDEKSGGVSYEKVRDEIEKDLEITKITATDLQDDIIGPYIIEEHRNQVTKRTKDDKFKRILAIHVSSLFQVSNVVPEQKLIWLKMIFDWF